jgi:hypothetical protein
VHLVRCFDNTDIIHVEPTIDPVRDIHIIDNELILADLASVEKRVGKKGVKAAGAGWANDGEVRLASQLLEDSFKLLQEGRPVRVLNAGLSPAEASVLRRLQLITSKPVLYVCNGRSTSSIEALVSCGVLPCAFSSWARGCCARNATFQPPRARCAMCVLRAAACVRHAVYAPGSRGGRGGRQCLHPQRAGVCRTRCRAGVRVCQS